jgi:hypothetical protein
MLTSSVLNIAQQASLAKAFKIKSCCETYKTDIVMVPHFDLLSTNLSVLIPKIEIAKQDKSLSRDMTGLIDEKNKKIEALVVKASGLAAALKTSESHFGDSESKIQFEKMLKSKLIGLSQALVIDTVDNFIIFLLKTNKVILEQYAVTTTELMDMKMECADARDFFKRKDAASKQKIEDNANLSTLFNELDALINNMTSVSSRFVQTSPKFYADYGKIVAFKAKAIVEANTKKNKKAREKHKSKLLLNNEIDKTDEKQIV